MPVMPSRLHRFLRAVFRPWTCQDVSMHGTFCGLPAGHESPIHRKDHRGDMCTVWTRQEIRP